MKNKEEYILCAAIWVKDGVKTNNQPKNIDSGFVITGRRHHNCFELNAMLSNYDIKKINKENIEQGFLTSKNRFLNRKESAKIAYDAKQVKELSNSLVSEDLY